MGYQAMNVLQKLKHEYRQEWTTKYSDNVAWPLLVLIVALVNGAVIYNFGVIPDLIFSLIISIMGGGLFCCLIDEILKSIYTRVRINRKLKELRRQAEIDSFDRFITDCRKLK
jgi:uncharacterized membrane protein